jgi:hypothetical protein
VSVKTNPKEAEVDQRIMFSISNAFDRKIYSDNDNN